MKLRKFDLFSTVTELLNHPIVINPVANLQCQEIKIADRVSPLLKFVVLHRGCLDDFLDLCSDALHRAGKARIIHDIGSVLLAQRDNGFLRTQNVEAGAGSFDRQVERRLIPALP